MLAQWRENRLLDPVGSSYGAEEVINAIRNGPRIENYDDVLDSPIFQELYAARATHSGTGYTAPIHFSDQNRIRFAFLEQLVLSGMPASRLTGACSDTRRSSHTWLVPRDQMGLVALAGHPGIREDPHLRDTYLSFLVEWLSENTKIAEVRDQVGRHANAPNEPDARHTAHRAVIAISRLAHRDTEAARKTLDRWAEKIAGKPGLRNHIKPKETIISIMEILTDYDPAIYPDPEGFGNDWLLRPEPDRAALGRFILQACCGNLKDLEGRMYGSASVWAPGEIRVLGAMSQEPDALAVSLYVLSAWRNEYRNTGSDGFVTNGMKAIAADLGNLLRKGFSNDMEELPGHAIVKEILLDMTRTPQGLPAPIQEAIKKTPRLHQIMVYIGVREKDAKPATDDKHEAITMGQENGEVIKPSLRNTSRNTATR